MTRLCDSSDPAPWVCALARRLPYTADAALRFRAKLLGRARWPRLTLFAWLCMTLAVACAAVGVGIAAQARPQRFPAPDRALELSMATIATLVGMGAGLAARLRWTRRLATSWVGWMLSARQRASQNRVAAFIASCGFAATAGLLGALMYLGGFLAATTAAAMGCGAMLGFGLGIAFAVNLRDVIRRCAAWTITRLSATPWLALQVPNPARVAFFALPCGLTSAAMAFGVAASDRLEVFLACVVLAALLATIALAELKPATPKLRVLLGWAGPLALKRLSGRLARTHGIAALALCSPLLALGFAKWPGWAVACASALALAAAYTGFIRQIAALQPSTKGSLFVAVHAAAGLTLLATLPLGGWLIPWHIRRLLRQGAHDWRP